MEAYVMSIVNINIVLLSRRLPIHLFRYQSAIGGLQRQAEACQTSYGQTEHGGLPSRSTGGVEEAARHQRQSRLNNKLAGIADRALRPTP